MGNLRVCLGLALACASISVAHAESVALSGGLTVELPDGWGWKVTETADSELRDEIAAGAPGSGNVRFLVERKAVADSCRTAFGALPIAIGDAQEEPSVAPGFEPYVQLVQYKGANARMTCATIPSGLLYVTALDDASPTSPIARLIAWRVLDAVARRDTDGSRGRQCTSVDKRRVKRFYLFQGNPRWRVMAPPDPDTADLILVREAPIRPFVAITFKVADGRKDCSDFNPRGERDSTLVSYGFDKTVLSREGGLTVVNACGRLNFSDVGDPAVLVAAVRTRGSSLDLQAMAAELDDVLTFAFEGFRTVASGDYGGDGCHINNVSSVLPVGFSIPAAPPIPPTPQAPIAPAPSVKSKSARKRHGK